MILVDTSAWVEFDRGSGAPAHRRLVELIADDRQVAVTEPVLMEVLAGARDGTRAAALRALLLSFSWISVEPLADFEEAAAIYRRCRAVGVTPRGMVDCLIAAVAIRRGVPVLAADGDFARLADVVPLQLDLA